MAWGWAGYQTVGEKVEGIEEATRIGSVSGPETGLRHLRVSINTGGKGSQDQRREEGRPRHYSMKCEPSIVWPSCRLFLSTTSKWRRSSFSEAQVLTPPTRR